MKEEIKIERSNGFGKNGRTVYYVRPLQECSNKSRKYSGFTHFELEEKKNKLIKKWYSPMIIYYSIEGKIIGSNNKENALKEYWRLCDLTDVGKVFEVNHLQTPEKGTDCKTKEGAAHGRKAAQHEP